MIAKYSTYYDHILKMTMFFNKLPTHTYTTHYWHCPQEEYIIFKPTIINLSKRSNTLHSLVFDTIPSSYCKLARMSSKLIIKICSVCRLTLATTTLHFRCHLWTISMDKTWISNIIVLQIDYIIDSIKFSKPKPCSGRKKNSRRYWSNKHLNKSIWSESISWVNDEIPIKQSKNPCQASIAQCFNVGHCGKRIHQGSKYIVCLATSSSHAPFGSRASVKLTGLCYNKIGSHGE